MMKNQLLQDMVESGAPSPAAQAKPAEASAFASDRTDWVGAEPEHEVPWFERWGRRAAIAGMCVTLTGLVSGGAWWMARERSIDNTLVMVAKGSMVAPRPAAGIPPAANIAAPASTPADASILRTVRDQTARPAPIVPDVSPIPAPQPAANAPSVAAAQAAAKAPRGSAAKPAANMASLARPPGVIVKVRTKAPQAALELAEPRGGQMAETMRQCRAMGYHAAQCFKRGCVATKFGLACRG